MARASVMENSGEQDAANIRFGLDNEGKPNYSATGYLQGFGLVDASATFVGSYVKKWKHDRDAGGYYTGGTISRQTGVELPQAASLYLVSDPKFTARLTSPLPEDDEFRDRVSAIVKELQPQDMLSIVYKIEPAKLALANSLLDKAKSEQRAGRSDEAAKLKMQAADVMNEPANYRANSISVVAVGDDPREVIMPHFGFVKFSITRAKPSWRAPPTPLRSGTFDLIRARCL